MVTYAIDGSILEVTAQGTYSTEEIAATFAEAKADARLPAAVLLLIDFQKSQANPSHTELESRWALIREFRARRIAFVVETVAQDRLAQLYQGHATEAGGAPPIEVFKGLQAARDWLQK